ncbi:MAG TPA: biopolymer transporter ExbD [Terracidiphilus sp.]|jgi:biopolymer transport protein ExbD
MNVNCANSASMQSEINVTPMIDVLLVLLIIFMVIVPVTSRGDLAAVPQPPHSLTSPVDPVVLEVLRNNQGGVDFKINQRAVALADLPARLTEIYANRSRRVLFIKGDDRLSFRDIAEAIDIGHAAGIDQVGLITPKAAVEM